MWLLVAAISWHFFNFRIEAHMGTNGKSYFFALIMACAAVSLGILIGHWFGILVLPSQEERLAAMNKASIEEHEKIERWEKCFDLLDTDKDGLLFAEELRNHVYGGKLDGQMLQAATEMYKKIQQVGHVIGHYPQGKYHIDVYAIAKVDLKLYDKDVERRIKKRF
jgi:hypothetical protein